MLLATPLSSCQLSYLTRARRPPPARAVAAVRVVLVRHGGPHPVPRDGRRVLPPLDVHAPGAARPAGDRGQRRRRGALQGAPGAGIYLSASFTPRVATVLGLLPHRLGFAPTACPLTAKHPPHGRPSARSSRTARRPPTSAPRRWRAPRAALLPAARRPTAAARSSRRPRAAARTCVFAAGSGSRLSCVCAGIHAGLAGLELTASLHLPPPRLPSRQEPPVLPVVPFDAVLSRCVGPAPFLGESGT